MSPCIVKYIHYILMYRPVYIGAASLRQMILVMQAKPGHLRHLPHIFKSTHVCHLNNGKVVLLRGMFNLMFLSVDEQLDRRDSSSFNNTHSYCCLKSYFYVLRRKLAIMW